MNFNHTSDILNEYLVHMIIFEHMIKCCRYCDVIHKTYKLDNVVTIDDAELNVCGSNAMLLINACMCYFAMLNHFCVQC